MTTPHEDDDEVFAQIIAGFGEPSGEPFDEDPPEGPPVVVPSQAEELGLPGWLEPAALPDEGHFEPPPAPRVPRVRARTALAFALLLMGLLVLFAPFQVGLDDSGVSLMIGLALTTGGAGLLLAGMRDAPPTGSGPDDGAIV